MICACRSVARQFLYARTHTHILTNMQAQTLQFGEKEKGSYILEKRLPKRRSSVLFADETRCEAISTQTRPSERVNTHPTHTHMHARPDSSPANLSSPDMGDTHTSPDMGDTHTHTHTHTHAADTHEPGRTEFDVVDSTQKMMWGAGCDVIKEGTHTHTHTHTQIKAAEEKGTVMDTRNWGGGRRASGLELSLREGEILRKLQRSDGATLKISENGV